MGLFRTLGRAVKRGLRSKVLQTALRGAAASVTGGQSEAAIRLAQRAATIAKQIGAKHKAGRMLATSGAAAEIASQKLTAMGPPKLKETPGAHVEWGGYLPEEKPETGRPKGRPSRTSSSRRPRRQKGTGSSTKPRGSGNRAVKKNSRTRRGSSGESRTRRKPPAGGRDLKALAAKWRAAGKPGRWIDWVKSNGQ